MTRDHFFVHKIHFIGNKRSIRVYISEKKEKTIARYLSLPSLAYVYYSLPCFSFFSTIISFLSSHAVSSTSLLLIRGLPARSHNKESYDFMVAARQRPTFIGLAIGRLMARWIQIRRVRADRHTTSSFYHVVPFFVRAAGLPPVSRASTRFQRQR